MNERTAHRTLAHAQFTRVIKMRCFVFSPGWEYISFPTYNRISHRISHYILTEAMMMFDDVVFDHYFAFDIQISIYINKRLNRGPLGRSTLEIIGHIISSFVATMLSINIDRRAPKCSTMLKARKRRRKKNEKSGHKHRTRHLLCHFIAHRRCRRHGKWLLLWALIK